MAVESVSEILQKGIVDALKVSTLTDYLNTSGNYSGIYTGDRFDKEDGYDPAAVPFVSVHMPLIRDSQTVSENITRSEATVNLFVYFGSCDPSEAEKSIKVIVNAIKVCLASKSYTDSLRRIGGFRNQPLVSDDGWGKYGQDLCFKLSLRYTLTVNNLMLLTSPAPPPEPDPEP